MLYAGAFGVFRAARISAVGHDFVQITVMVGENDTSEVLAHVSQASIRFEVFSPQTDAEREEKVLFGFSEPQEAPK